MAIDTLALDVSLNETSPKNKTSLNSSKHPHGGTSRRLVKINLTANEGSVCSSKGKQVKLRKNNENQSPYLMGDTIHSVTVERFIEKTLVHKKGAEYSSFPFAANLYKASSDEFKNVKKKNNKKVKKSVLTLPNNPAPVPQLCTVSDRNDSDNSFKKLKKNTNKNSPIALPKKVRAKQKELGFYNRDAQYCTELNIDLNCSSTEIIKGKGGKKVITTRKSDNNNNVNLSDVWAVLRNINRFQFRPSPPISEDSYEAPIKRKGANRCNTRKDVRLVEATRAEEYEYISRLDLNQTGRYKKSYSPTPSTSPDNITVVGNNNQVKYKLTGAVKGPVDKLSIQNNKSNKRNSDKTVPRKVNNFIQKTHLNNKTSRLNTFDRKNIFGDTEFSSTSTFAHGFDDNFFNNLKKPVNSTHVKKPQPIEFVYSENSGSSKAALAAESGKNKKSFGGSEYLPRSRSPRCNHQKVNVNELRRKLAKLKFPIVVLGKDQLSSAFKAHDGFSQFAGLEETIWPFMVEWPVKENRQRTKRKSINSPKVRSRNGSAYRKTDHEFATNNNKKFNKEKCAMEPKVVIRNKMPQKRITSPEKLGNEITLEHEKSKQSRHLKHKMLKFLYKSSSSQSSVGEMKVIKRKSMRNSANIVDASTETSVFKYPSIEQIANDKTDNNKITNGKHRRVKGKWDFIDNVIKKIRSGVYYSRDDKATNKVPTFKEAHVQTITETIVPESSVMQPKETQHNSILVTHQKPELLFVIPGFEEDNILPKLEIKSMNLKEIALKNCTTNIMVRFDVTLPNEPTLNLTKSNSLIPLTATESLTRVFKCKTNIINAMLPEELCSVLPSILSKLNNSIEYSAFQTPDNVEKTHLSPIPELVLLPMNQVSNLPFRNNSKELLLLLDGSYSMPPAKYLKFTIFDTSQLRSHLFVMDLLPKLQRSHFFVNNVDPMILPVLIKPEKQEVPFSLFLSGQAECTALELYPASKRRVIPKYNRFDLIGILENICRFASDNLLRVQRCWIDRLLNNNIKFIKLSACNTNGYRNSIIFDLKKFVNTVGSANPDTQIDINHSMNVVTRSRFSEIEDEAKRNSHQALVLNSKLKRKKFVKLYKKCKSASNISGDRTSTPLSKISNLDDFFLALGSGKVLAGVFDQFRERKILSSLVEMKSWISEINPKQALLVLLLNNKKETPSLVRYRPVILQGIAMNRITQANELDMEIEVIERENMSKRTLLCEGISYLPASAENKDSLYEELCWIAKTTASDYQRIFDESSKQLLKSLLQKRKKLNPSYLRVMARYVGLGLLRAPNKK